MRAAIVQRAVRTIRVLARAAALLVILAGIAWVGVNSDWHPLAVGPVVVAAALPLWQLAHPRSYRQLITAPSLRRRKRRWYRESFDNVMEACGLVQQRQGSLWLPWLGDVQLGPFADRLQVAMVSGQAFVDFEKASDRIAAAFEARRCCVVATGPRSLCLELDHGDALATRVPPLAIAANPDLQNVPIGRREDGSLWTLPVLGTHCFIAGATGAGKGSVIWALLRGVAGSIRSGSTQVWAIDPKGGMELGFGQPLFTRFSGGSTEEMCQLLEEAVALMERRCRTLAGRTRLHLPTPEDPMVLVLIDELASLPVTGRSASVQRPPSLRCSPRAGPPLSWSWQRLKILARRS